MHQSGVERRRGRRIGLEALLVTRQMDGRQVESHAELLTKNVSLAGLYFETDQAEPYRVNEPVIASVVIAESQRREFPFTRLAGPAQVVRVSELPPPSESTDTKRFGVALGFAEGLIALTATPLR